MARFGMSSNYPSVSIEEAPDVAAPTLLGSAILIYPQAVAFTGTGKEGRRVGKPFVVVAREYISATGYDWYYDYWNEQESNSATIHIQAYDPATPGWVTYSAVMHRPTYTNQSRARSEPTFTGFECRFTDLVAA